MGPILYLEVILWSIIEVRIWVIASVKINNWRLCTWARIWSRFPALYSSPSLYTWQFGGRNARSIVFLFDLLAVDRITAYLQCRLRGEEGEAWSAELGSQGSRPRSMCWRWMIAPSTGRWSRDFSGARNTEVSYNRSFTKSPYFLLLACDSSN